MNRLQRRWAIAIAGSLAVVIGFFTIGRMRTHDENEAPRLVPLASELEGTRGVELYFGSPGADSLSPEYRDVVVKDRPQDQVRSIYRELLAGPSREHVALFPEGTELLEAYWTDKGTLYLDWNRTLAQGFRGGSAREHALIASIVRTAGENLPGVERVMILVEGEPVETIGGHFDVLSPLPVKEWR